MCMIRGGAEPALPETRREPGDRRRESLATWFKAACVPAIVGLAVTPLLVFKMFPPEIQNTPDAPVEAAKKLEKLAR